MRLTVPSWAITAHQTLLEMPDGGYVLHPPLCPRCRKWAASERGWCPGCMRWLVRTTARAHRAQR